MDRIARVGIIALVVIILLGLLVAVMVVKPFYLFETVEADEIGVRYNGGQIKDVVGPGIYSDFGLYVSMKKFTTQSYQFTVEDAEVITADNQRLGVTVSGSVFRPGLIDVEKIRQLWTKYEKVYTNDDALQAVISNLATQAMKVCVGDRPYQDSVIGSDRDSLRNCIDTELNKLAVSYGLSITNVTVPNVALSPAVQELLDAITRSRLETEKAVQDKQKAITEGEARRAEQEAQIRIEQSKLQETTKQQTILAQLEQEKLVAQQAVIEAQKNNDLLSAQRDLEINKAQAAAAIEKARADLARELALAEIYAKNSNYYQYQMALVNASAIKSTDKLIFVQEGTFPQLVFGNNLSPVVPVGTTPTPQ
ncbi:MAG TPA: SPFH domain-containing protein [Anaerolineaceae bacterium]|nr:SPFH domain-containing protein [Anaerolineaceae bacterium]HPN51284.1 SPFH domain-containing protein [Anaerolineaceae bacterium]